MLEKIDLIKRSQQSKGMPITDISQIYALLQKVEREGIILELTSETKTYLKMTKKEEKPVLGIDREYFLHMLIQDSHLISKKIRNSFNIKDDEIKNIDGFLSDFKNEHEDSAELLKRVRESY